MEIIWSWGEWEEGEGGGFFSLGLDLLRSVQKIKMTQLFPLEQVPSGARIPPASTIS